MFRASWLALAMSAAVCACAGGGPCAGHGCGQPADGLELSQTSKLPEALILSVKQAAKRLWRAGEHRHFRPLSEQEQALLTEALQALVGGDSSVWGRQREFAAQGLALERWTLGNGVWSVLFDTTNAGRGAFLFREGKRRDDAIMVQSPHAFYDSYTGKIGLGLATSDQRVAAFFSNTSHRYGDGENDNADAAHSEEHALFILTQRYLETRRLPVLQLHGFAAREDAATDVVVSAGLKRASTRSRAIAESLKKSWPTMSVSLYPDEINVLGGTTNVEGRLCHASGQEFIHLEMSKKARVALKKDKLSLRGVVDALVRDSD